MTTEERLSKRRGILPLQARTKCVERAASKPTSVCRSSAYPVAGLRTGRATLVCLAMLAMFCLTFFVLFCLAAVAFFGASWYDDTRDRELYNAMVAARNAVFATPINRQSDIDIAKRKLERLRHTNVSGADSELQILHARLVDLADTHLKIRQDAVRILEIREELKNGGAVDKLVGLFKVPAAISDLNRVKSQTEVLQERFHAWERQMKRLAERRSWNPRR